MPPYILLVDPIHQSGLDLLKGFTVIPAVASDEETLCRQIKGITGVILRSSNFTRKIIEASDKLKVIARRGMGTANIDMAAATERGIIVFNTLDVNAISVAEFTITAIGALAKRIIASDKAAREGRWAVRDEYKTVDLDGKTLGVIGLGNIGRLTAWKAQAAFGMRVIAFTRSHRPEAQVLGVKLTDSLPELLKEADVVTIHAELNEQTRSLINYDCLRLMKKNAFLINTSRGEIIVECDLVRALNEGLIAGAALDVFTQEPLNIDSPFFKMDNVLISPHMASLTEESAARMAVDTARGLLDIFNGSMPQHVVNREVLAQFQIEP